ncbi:hypothetical protein BV898_02202 [Hypsibius exemplaris]|uniref:Uncharacterized protein n=1 Tax=Hypsibius exemplaris TaxID=2072580 RepID=A0A1W0X8M9_HYPEX|nr:hypothetical protein BV898_02202 [Hypsibius exemplaris]
MVNGGKYVWSNAHIFYLHLHIMLFLVVSYLPFRSGLLLAVHQRWYKGSPQKREELNRRLPGMNSSSFNDGLSDNCFTFSNLTNAEWSFEAAEVVACLMIKDMVRDVKFMNGRNRMLSSFDGLFSLSLILRLKYETPCFVLNGCYIDVLDASPIRENLLVD